MSNIYLQLPSYHAAYVRNSFDPPLRKNEPVKYGEYSIERAYMLHGCVPIAGHKEAVPICYSEREWKNMLQGRRPDGGPVIRQRDPTEYLTHTEVRDLCGSPLTIKSDNFDYLCIQIPQNVIIEGRQCRTNSIYNLDHGTAMLLRSCIQEDFMTRLRIFMIAAHHFNFCPQANPKYFLDQKIVNTIERFLMCYDIPVSSDYTEFKAIRKMIQRHVPDLSKFLTQREIEHLTFPDSADKVIHVNSEECKQLLSRELNKVKRKKQRHKKS